MPNVSTWAEFIYAMQNVTSDSVITLTADLDANDTLPEGLAQLTQIECPLDATRVSNVIINGNGHAIYNFDNTGKSTSGYFKLNVINEEAAFSINNVQFLNLACSSSNRPVFYIGTSGAAGRLEFNDCVIQGNLNCPFAATNAKFNRCMLTIRSSSNNLITGSTSSYSYFNECWFRINVLKMTSGSYLPYLTSCYIEGNITYAAFSNVNGYVISTSCEDCCINVNGDVSGLTLSFTVNQLFNPTGTKINVLNTTKFKTTGHESTSLFLKEVTDEQMHDAEYLANIGFDIVP